ncbi:MAG: CoA transferase, partial [Acetobacteraceae bacterium]|nr:CoA transferase [Acetobacteraceae bacterium]
DRTFEDRGIFQTIQHPVVGEFRMPAWPVRFGGKPPTVTPAPLLGQHTQDVLQEWLGMDAATADSLKQARVV